MKIENGNLDYLFSIPDLLIMLRTNKIVLSPTESCNFNCSHCGTAKQNKKSYISMRSLKKMLLVAKKSGIKNLFITGGGEPLINFGKIVKIINLAKGHGFKITLNTNGYFISTDPRNAIEKLKNLDKIVFSIDYDHLKFISYSSLLKSIEAALDSHLKVEIKIANRKATKRKNLFMLKRLAKDLHGRIVNITPFIGNLSFIRAPIYLIFARKIISVFSFDIMRTEVNRKIEHFQPMKFNGIVFSQCKNFTPVIDSYSNLLPCCSFVSANNPQQYKLSGNDDGDVENSNLFLKSILFGNFPFIKIFLRVRKDRELLNEFLGKKYYSICDFCLQTLRHKKEIEAIKQPTKLEIVIYIVSKMHYVLYYGLAACVTRAYERFYRTLINVF